MTITLPSIEEALRLPFPPEQIKFLPKTVKKNDQGQMICLAFPYANKRVYEDRLNELAFGHWSTPYTSPLVAGNKLVLPITVVVCGVVHTDYGEAFLSSFNREKQVREEENSATEAYSQGFRRACAQFRLGRYLYDLAKVWLPYDSGERAIALSNEQRVILVEKLYRKAGLLLAPPATRSPSSLTKHEDQTPEATVQPEELAATNQQLASICTLRHHLNLAAPAQEQLSFQTAKALIAQLSQQYNQQKKRSPSSAVSTPTAHIPAGHR